MKKYLLGMMSVLVVAVFAFLAIASGSSETPSVDEQPEGTAAIAETESNVGDYIVEIKDARITVSFDGKPAIVVTYGFTNNASDPTAFYLTFEDGAFQNDIGLNEALFLSDNDPYSSDNQTKEIKTGATIDVDVAYELNDSESDVVIEVSELFGWSDDKVTKTFSIK